MQIRIEEHYPSYFCKSNLDLIFLGLNSSHCTTIFWPSGTGLSHLLRFVAYNKRYRRRYKNIAKTDFIYVNIDDLDTFKVDLKIDTQILQTSYSELLKKLLINSILEFLGQQKTILETQDSREILFSLIDDYLKKNNSRTLFFILDGTDKLLDKNDPEINALLKTIREKYKYKVEYIFGFNNINWLEKLNTKNNLLTSLLTQKIVILKMLNAKEYMTKLAATPRELFFYNLITKRTRNYKKEVELIDQLCGGYMSYFKIIKNNLPKAKKEKTTININNLIHWRALNPSLDMELRYASERLLNSLTKEQFLILKDLTSLKPVKLSKSLQILEQLGIIIRTANKIKIFSPIMTDYLRTVTSIPYS